MPDTINTTQNAQIGSHDNNLIGQQINNYGIQTEDAAVIAIDAAFKLFHQYFPQLQKEALDEVHRMLEDKLNNIPIENVVQPSPRIVVPALQNASITEETELRDLYANLLAASMNKVVKDGVHPAYVEIINQLSPDEARLLQYMSIFQTIPTISLRAEDKDESGITIVDCFSNIGEIMKCENPYEIGKYFDNLERLGLIRRSDGLSSLSDKSKYEPLKTHTFIEEKEQSIRGNSDRNIPRIIEGFAEVTSFGRAFCSTCVTNPLNFRISN